jgi:4-hydroxy-tetrahydrodipicolinate synthase
MSSPALGRLLTAIVTPFGEDDAVDYDAFQRLAAFLFDNGSDGLVVAGTTGEGPTLTDDERVGLVRAALEVANGRGTVVANTGTNSTADSIQLTKRAEEAGADGLLIVTPYYNRPPQRGIVKHFEAIAAATDRPIIVYNIPSRSVINIEPDTMSQLAEIPNVTGVKQAHAALDEAQHIVDIGLDLYAGDDNIVQPFLELGAVGGICVHTHIVGPQVAAQVEAVSSGDVERGRALDAELRPAYDLLQAAPNPLGIKAALNLLGHGVGKFRLPLVPPTDDELARVRECLERQGLLAGAAR